MRYRKKGLRIYLYFCALVLVWSLGWLGLVSWATGQRVQVEKEQWEYQQCLHNFVHARLVALDEVYERFVAEGYVDENVKAGREWAWRSYRKQEYCGAVSMADQVELTILSYLHLGEERSARVLAQMDELLWWALEIGQEDVDVGETVMELRLLRADLVGGEVEEVLEKVEVLKVGLEEDLEAKKEAQRQKALELARAQAARQATAPQQYGGVSYQRQNVSTARGVFVADVLSFDLSQVWARTFTAHEDDCQSDCPLKPLASYVAENGGVAGINGSYFCPADYASCDSRKNSFDLLVFDYRSKKYLNSDNNQYSVNPLMNFYPGSANLYMQASGYGRDTGVDGVVSNYPALLQSGNVVVNEGALGGNMNGKGTRGGIGFAGSRVWAVIVRGASVGDAAYVFQALGAQNAMNLDGGGSAAMYVNGSYRVGPGRNLPNVVVFGNR
jgi:hypothetical protein